MVSGFPYGEFLGSSLTELFLYSYTKLPFFAKGFLYSDVSILNCPLPV